MTFHYPRGEFVGIGKQPKILCIHFYLTFFALLDQRPRSDSLFWFLMRHPISSTLSQFFSRVDPFPVFLSALLSKQLLPAIYQPVLLELECQTSKGFLCIRPRTFFKFIRPRIQFSINPFTKVALFFIKYGKFLNDGSQRGVLDIR